MNGKALTPSPLPLLSWAVWGSTFVQLCTMLASSSSFDKGWRKAALCCIFSASSPLAGYCELKLTSRTTAFPTRQLWRRSTWA